MQVRRWIECRSIHSERTEDLALTETAEAVVGEALERDAQKDEADVTIFRMLSGIVSERCGKDGRKKFIAGSRPKKKLFISR